MEVLITCEILIVGSCVRPETATYNLTPAREEICIWILSTLSYI